MDNSSTIEFLRLRNQAIPVARDSLIAFTLFTKKGYEVNWHHRLVSRYLDRFARGEIKNLMVFMPPQHGKSELVSRRLPAYVLGKKPDKRIALASYGAEWSQSFNRDVQRIIDDDAYRQLFPRTQLSGKNVAHTSFGSFKRTADIFEVVGRTGWMKTVGIGGALTGSTVDVGLIDDPFKDRQEANSQVTRNHVWSWFTDVFETRLHNDSQQLLTMTRWHEDDLAGRILDRDGEAKDGGKWVVIRLPALREDDHDPEDPRQIGEALWESRHSRERMEEIRDKSPMTFASMYQQRPAPAEGNKVKRDWFQFCHEKEVPGGIVWDLWVDGAYTKNTANDPSGFMVAGFHAPTKKMYVRHAHHAYMEMPQILKFIPEYADTHGLSIASRVRAEPKATGKSLVQMINADPMLRLNAVEIRNYLVQEGKEARLQVAAPKIEVGNMILVRGNWNDKFVTQICSFPNATHDEYVDLAGYACLEYFGKPRRGGVDYD